MRVHGYLMPSNATKILGQNDSLGVALFIARGRMRGREPPFETRLWSRLTQAAPMSDVTRLLGAMHGGSRASEALLPLVYAELRQLARAKMAREQPGHTLQPTALVHEAWLRLGEQSFENRAHFFGAAAEAMRRILVERARSKGREKRGAGAEHVDVDGIEITAPIEDGAELLRVHEVLDCFAAEDPQKAELVKLRFFVGLSLTEAVSYTHLRAHETPEH